MITLNDYSSLAPKGEDGLEAVCRRITFEASRNRDLSLSLEQYKKFAKQKWHVTEQLIEDWLGDQACVLLIDELNNVPQTISLAGFLKRNFVSRAKRYLVFTSHVLAIGGQLSQFMDPFSGSMRKVVLRNLPLIPSLSMARKNLNWPSLSPRQALYYGRIPALVHEAHLDGGHGDHLPASKREKAIEECITEGLTPDSIRHFMGTFITGNRLESLRPLESLMTAQRDTAAQTDTVEWIPFFMMEALLRFSSYQGFKGLKDIARLFAAFMDAKESSGDGWECLFVAVLLIRCWAQLGDCFLVPFQLDAPCTFSYNNLFAGDFATQKVRDCVNGIKDPTSFPHVAIFYPSHASFELYDVIVAHFDQWGKHHLYGYQLKEGKALPKEESLSIFEKSFVIRGQAAKESNVGKNWVRASEEQINTFFGVSGRLWTPQQWKKLCEDSNE